MKNLNQTKIPDADNEDSELQDFSVIAGKHLSVYFRNIEDRLVEHIKKADAVFGCIAWLTNERFLGELSKLKNVSIIVQKEDFLRPDVENIHGWKAKLRKNYESLNCDLSRYDFPNALGYMSVAGDPSIASIRCVGNHNRDKSPAFPRMHNKFLIFASVQRQGSNDVIEPYGVWTGSFNLTKNATYSLENALYTEDPKIVRAFFLEYGQIAAISEPLDWSSEWVAPEWRIGT